MSMSMSMSMIMSREYEYEVIKSEGVFEREFQDDRPGDSDSPWFYFGSISHASGDEAVLVVST